MHFGRTDILLVMLLFLLFVRNGHTQDILLEFDHLSLEDDLSGYWINSLVRDKSGYLWVGTQRGANRYDGARAKKLTRFGALELRLVNDDIQVLVEDVLNPGNVWIGTSSGGVSLYDQQSDNVANFTVENSNLSSNEVRSLLVDSYGSVWIGTNTEGLNVLDPDSVDFRDNLFNQVDLGSLVSDSIRALYESSAMPGKLWVGTTRGLSVIDIPSRQVDPLSRYVKGLSKNLSTMAVTAITENKQGLWIGTEQGRLFNYSLQDRELTELSEPINSAPFEQISALEPSSRLEDILWVGSRVSGLFAFNTHLRTASQYVHDSENSKTISRSYVISLLEDSTGVLWVGTAVGLNKTLLEPKRFEPSLDNPRNESEILEASVMSLYERPSQSGVVWLSLLSEGISRYDRVNKTLSRVEQVPDSVDFVLAMVEDSEDNLWLGGNHYALFVLQEGDKRFEAIRLFGDKRTVIHHISKSSIHNDHLWISTRDQGLILFDPKERKIISVFNQSQPAGNRLSSDYIWFVEESPFDAGILWIATRYGGVNRLDTKTKEIQIFDSNSHCLPNDDIITITSKSKNELWLGTYGSGFVHFDVNANECDSYSADEGLPYTDVSAIFQDKAGRLWLSTSNGLSLFHPELKSFTNFKERDGLQSDVFHYHARHQNKASEIFLGGTRGFNIFHPEQIKINKTQPEIVLTKLLVDGEPFPIKKTVDGIASVSLKHNQNDLAFEFAALDLWQPSKNQYKVKLEGAEEDWRYIGPQTFERYPQLKFGKYTFHVTGSNYDGIWSDRVASLGIEIMPPITATVWFWLMVASLFSALVAAAYQYRITQLKKVEETRHRIADDLHDEIGSKMSAIALRLDITSRSDHFESSDQKQLKQLSVGARDIVNDLRDVVWIVDSGFDNISHLINRMEQDADQMLRHCRYTFEVKPKVLDMALKMEFRRHLYLLFKEALHNASRHSKAKNVDIQLLLEKERITMSIKDDGVGFDMRSVEAGRGLSTMETRAKALKGTLKIEGIPGGGTSVLFHTRIM